MIIGLIGKKQSGKDTFAQILIDHYGFRKRAFADPLKEACALLFQLHPDQLHDPVQKETVDPRWGKTPREIMQIVGTDLFRNHYDQHFWLKLFTYWCHAQDSNVNIICTDIRFANEAQLIRSMKGGGGILIKITRPTVQYEDQHESEKIEGIMDTADFEIINDSTLTAYQQKIQDLCSLLFGHG